MLLNSAASHAQAAGVSLQPAAPAAVLQTTQISITPDAIEQVRLVAHDSIVSLNLSLLLFLAEATTSESNFREKRESVIVCARRSATDAHQERWSHSQRPVDIFVSQLPLFSFQSISQCNQSGSSNAPSCRGISRKCATQTQWSCRSTLERWASKNCFLSTTSFTACRCASRKPCHKTRTRLL